MSGTDERCEYCFDPAAWEREHDRPAQLDEDVLNEDGVWTCPHPAGDDGCCLFHRPVDEKDDAAVAAAFVDTVYDSGDGERVEASRRREFVGARFGDFEIPFVTLDTDDNFPIDLRHASVEGDLDWRQTILNHPVWLSGVDVAGDGRFGNLRSEADFDLSRAVLGGEANFNDAEFGSNVWALESHVGGELRLQRVRVAGDVDFTGSTVKGNVWLTHGDVDGVAAFSNMTVDGGLLCTRSRFGGSFWAAQSTFEAVHEENNYLSNSTFEADFRIRDTDFDDSLLLRGSTVEGSFEFVRSTVADNRVVCTGATFSEGTFGQPDGDHLIYDCTNATLGDVVVEPTPAAAGFGQIKFENTEFDGFEFGEHSAQLADAEWEIHTVKGESGQSNATIENTYLKAKNGANDSGDSKVASKFFQNEMSYRRRAHADMARRSDRDPWPRLKSVGAWVANASLGLLTGYGERPRRVFGAAVVVIAAFGVFFWGLNFPETGTLVVDASPVGMGTVELPRMRYLVLSFQSFISFAYGAPDAGARVAVRLLTAVEGFFGSFLVALLVFTLTRSVHR